MGITKKDIPLIVLETIEPIAQANLDVIQFKPYDNTYYNFVDTDLKSKNFFRVFINGTKIVKNYNRDLFAIEYKPSGKTKTDTTTAQGEIGFVANQLKDWIKILRDYENTISLHDDNFTKRYADYYYEEFKVYDGDANISPFDPAQQDIIDLYLDAFKGAVENSSEQLGEDLRNVILLEIGEIKENLPASTKTQVMKRVTKLFALIYKKSRVLGKEIVTEAKKILIRKLLDIGVEYAPKVIESLKQSIYL